MTVESEIFSMNLTKYDISTFGCEGSHENSLGFVRLITFEAKNRDLWGQWDSNEYKGLEKNILTLFSVILSKYEIYELVFPPVHTARNMRKPGLYKLDSIFKLNDCLIEGIKEHQDFQLFIPKLKVIIEQGHDFFFSISYHKSQEPTTDEIQKLQDLITQNDLKLNKNKA